MKPKLSNDFIINQVQNYFNKHGKLPTSKLSENEIGFKPRLARTRFGSWNNLIIASGLVKPSIYEDIECLNCPTIFSGKISENRKFCSRSCANSFNNHKEPKRKKQKQEPNYCIICNSIIADRRKYCNNHNPNIVDWSTITYGEVKSLRKYQKNSRIRAHARALHLSEDLECQICGYDKHVEIHHIKPISTFSHETFISEINDKSNIAILCPNCHWEVHNNLLDLAPSAGLEPA